ncbi:DUF6151 family protein [Kiloniella laminariae]|uniref:DUF6151 family protein n=1 Tax=Kiloniella laminariae TaxID=454162 RepID=A0ABT4LFG3_9PROT|nr:DUF6151 family protein [Kiloniella laminariae]MCZ4279851.1 DUF6151 family protein [Kiloniella laminariae]
MTDIPLSCSCGKVQGLAHNVSPGKGTRIVCYCDDCQAFARYLGRETEILDEYGGTDIYQLTPAQLKISHGAELLRSLRLTPDGLLRWYCDCCKTPVGNTFSAGLPVVGLVHSFMGQKAKRSQNLGPVRSYVMGKYARGTPPGPLHKGFPLKLLLRVIPRAVANRLLGRHRPTPFFTPDGKPVSDPIIVSEKQ